MTLLRGRTLFFCMVMVAGLAQAAHASLWEDLLGIGKQDTLKVIYQGGGTKPWQPQYAIKVENGMAELKQYNAMVEPNDVDPNTLTLAEVKLDEADVRDLIRHFEQGGYFEAAEKHKDVVIPHTGAGTYGTVIVRRDGETYSLSADNATVPELNAAIFSLQKIFPAFPLPVPRELKQ
jgi:hypothetical protein